MYLAIVITIQVPNFYAENDYAHDLKYFEVTPMTIPNFCVCMFSYLCHMNVASIYSEMPNPISRKMKKANLMAVCLEFGVYMGIAVFGYLSTLELTPGMFYERN